MPKDDPYELTQRFSVQLSEPQVLALAELSRRYQTGGASTIVRLLLNKYLPVEYPEYAELFRKFSGEQDG